MKIEVTDVELTLLVETVETSTYPGKFARLVADLLEKLQAEAASKCQFVLPDVELPIVQ